MDLIRRLSGVIIVLVVIGAAAAVYFTTQSEQHKITYSTSDAKDLKGDISIALDSWIGYYPFHSTVFGKLMRDDGYRIKVIDDNADYAGRMEMLKEGKIDFCVATVDAYVQNGKDVLYPGTIVTIIDESNGGDAIVAAKNKAATLDALKTSQSLRIAYTPDSPSEHLLRAISLHFGIDFFSENTGYISVETTGAKEAYELLKNGEADIAVLWEPHVAKATGDPKFIKLIGSDNAKKLIIDILIVNREFASTKSDVVQTFLKNYYKTLTYYKNSNSLYKEEIVKELKLKADEVDTILQGVRWLTYPENLNWYGLSSSGLNRPELVSVIDSTVDILLSTGEISDNPLPDKDPYTIINSSFLKQIDPSLVAEAGGDSVTTSSLQESYSQLSEEEWNSLPVVGSLKLRPISFRSGTSELDERGTDEVTRIVSHLSHYPRYRILVKGHTGTRGDAEANRLLSEERATAVQTEMITRFGIDKNRIRAIGLGSKEPLTKRPGESDREYENRLKRVEIQLVSEGEASQQ